jgi:ribosomal protein S17E
VSIIGNIRTKDIKRTSFNLLGKFPEKLGRDFVKNKDVLNSFNVFVDKRLRNKVAGYIATIAKRKKE